jgi:hypothetical protein
MHILLQPIARQSGVLSLPQGNLTSLNTLHSTNGALNSSKNLCRGLQQARCALPPGAPLLTELPQGPVHKEHHSNVGSNDLHTVPHTACMTM